MQDDNLPGAELDILACLWRSGGQATARELREMLAPFRPMAHGSVVSLLNRLETKGLVTKRKGDVGKAFIFMAVRRPEPTYRRLLGNILERVFGGDQLALVSSLFETRPPSLDEIKEMRRMLEELSRKARRDVLLGRARHTRSISNGRPTWTCTPAHFYWPATRFSWPGHRRWPTRSERLRIGAGPRPIDSSLPRQKRLQANAVAG